MVLYQWRVVMSIWCKLWHMFSILWSTIKQLNVTQSKQSSERKHTFYAFIRRQIMRAPYELYAHILRKMSTVFRKYSEDHLSHYPKTCCSWKLIWHFYIIYMIKHFYSVCSVKLQRPHNAYTHYRNVFSDIYAVFVVFINFHAWILIKNTKATHHTDVINFQCIFFGFRHIV